LKSAKRKRVVDKDSLPRPSLPDPSSKQTATEEKQKVIPERPPLPSTESVVTPQPLPIEDPPSPYLLEQMKVKISRSAAALLQSPRTRLQRPWMGYPTPHLVVVVSATV
jgi:hypothetical protein